MARPVPGRGETRDRGHPRRLFETNGMHGASGYRVRTDAQHATPLAGPTYRAQTRYRLAGPHPASEKLPTGRGTGPLSRAGILALQGGEDVNGGELKAYSTLLGDSRDEAIDRMEADAAEMGADAVVNMRLETSEIANGGAEVMAYGTAVRLE